MPSSRGKNGRSKAEQLALNWREWGGARKGAGRKRTVRSRVPHRRRKGFARSHPLHVTTKCLSGLPSLRARRTAAELMEKIAEGSERKGFRLVHYSLQRDHIHMIVEADDRASLASGMKGLLVRLARTLNRLWDRTGAVFKRFHDQVLASPRQVRNALRYVLLNARKHRERIPTNRPDPLSSGAAFDGWKHVRRTSPRRRLTAPASSWLLRTGWLHWGRISLTEHPA